MRDSSCNKGELCPTIKIASVQMVSIIAIDAGVYCNQLRSYSILSYYGLIALGTFIYILACLTSIMRDIKAKKNENKEEEERTVNDLIMLLFLSPFYILASSLLSLIYAAGNARAIWRLNSHLSFTRSFYGTWLTYANMICLIFLARVFLKKTSEKKPKYKSTTEKAIDLSKLLLLFSPIFLSYFTEKYLLGYHPKSFSTITLNNLMVIGVMLGTIAILGFIAFASCARSVFKGVSQPFKQNSPQAIG